MNIILLSLLFNLQLLANDKLVDISQIPKMPTEIQKYTRIVAIGDLHGDWEQTKKALLLSGAFKKEKKGFMSTEWQWTGGNTYVVQVGDQLDRWHDDRKIMDTLAKLRILAAKGGGGFFPLLGNHEIMNLQFKFKYVTKDSMNLFRDFDDKGPWRFSTYLPPDYLDMLTEHKLPHEPGRFNAFSKNGYYRKLLSTQNVVMKIGDIIFVHGGIGGGLGLSLEELNNTYKEWILNGDPNKKNQYIDNEAYSPVWTKIYYDKHKEEPNCSELEKALKLYKASMMVVGHIKRDKIRSNCNGKLWLIDVGMSRAFNEEVQILDLRPGVPPRVLK
jgi:predicted MPP superfamily phosphohydrolase